VANPVAGTWTVKVTGTSIPTGAQNFAFCSNATFTQVLAAVIQASPTSGSAPLTVSFSAGASVGNIVTYNWDFGDGTTGIGPSISHIYQFPAPPATIGNYTAKLTVTDIGGKSSSATVTITVTKPVVGVFPSMASGKVSLVRPTANSFNATMIVPDLVRTPQQAREAVRDGIFEGKKFNITAGLVDPLTGNANFETLYNFLLDRHASESGSTENIKIDLKRGAIVMKFKTRLLAPTRDMSTFYRHLGITETTTTPYNFTLRVRAETDDAVYQCDYLMTFIGKNGSGSVK